MNGERQRETADAEMLEAVLSILPDHVREAVEHSILETQDVLPAEAKAALITSLHLGDEQQRQNFLWQYYAQGDEALFAAVNHIWNSLGGNRAAHCALVGSLSGTGGSGKAALALTLQQFLQECLAFNAELPRLADFPDVDSWHLACLKCWEDDAAHARAQCRRYSAFLDGRKPGPENSC